MYYDVKITNAGNMNKINFSRKIDALKAIRAMLFVVDPHNAVTTESHMAKQLKEPNCPSVGVSYSTKDFHVELTKRY